MKAFAAPRLCMVVDQLTFGCNIIGVGTAPCRLVAARDV
jgi:hypothetical protein